MKNGSQGQQTVAARVWISGIVQGVFYRASTQKKAETLRIHGWVKNLPDGRVEALFQGTPDRVETMIQWCNQGPPGARVSQVVVDYQEAQDIEGFKIKYDPR